MLDLENFVEKLDSWYPKLKPVFESQEMYNLYQELKEIGKREKITPKASDLWNCFKYCPQDKLNVIIIGMDSYPGIYPNKQFQADGIAFSNSYSPDGKLQPSLEKFYDAIDDSYDRKHARNKDLKYLAAQGVLLANRSFACKLNKPGSLMGKFDFFWKNFFEEISVFYHGVPIVLIGKDAQRLKKYIFELVHPVLECEHPSAAAREHRDWNHNNIFLKVDKILKQNNNLEIEWAKPLN